MQHWTCSALLRYKISDFFRSLLEGYRDQTLTLYQVSEMLGLSRVETEDFLGQHHVPLAVINEADLDREAALFEAASRRNPR
jgi:hypothetical protein